MPKPFKPMKARFRATFGGSQLGAGRLGSVDKENEILLYYLCEIQRADDFLSREMVPAGAEKSPPKPCARERMTG